MSPTVERTGVKVQEREENPNWTRYMITPAKGRIAKSRQIRSFEVRVNSRPHNLTLLGLELVKAINKYIKRYDAYAVVYEEPGDGHYKAEVFYGQAVLCAQLYIAYLAEEEEA